MAESQLDKVCNCLLFKWRCQVNMAFIFFASARLKNVDHERPITKLPNLHKITKAIKLNF